MSQTPPHYSMVIEWSDTDQAYIVSLPEWTGIALQPVTHGDTYEEAVKNGHEVLEMLIEDANQDGIPLPAPKLFVA